jgi:hypothetical protein
MARHIDLQNAVNQLAGGNVSDFNGIYFALTGKMQELGAETVRKPAVRPNGHPAGGAQRGLLDYISECGAPNGDLTEARNAEIKAEQIVALQAMRWVLDNRYALSGYTPKQPEPEDRSAPLT